MRVGDCSYFDGELADELGEWLFPSLGNAEEFDLPSDDSKAGNLKLVGIGLSYISKAKGDLCLEFSPASSFDLVTSLCTSSSRLFTCQSCPRSESVEFDNKVSGSRGCAPPRVRYRGVSPGSISSLQYLSGVSVDCPASAKSSYVGHIIATVSDTLPTTHCQEQCSLLPGALLAGRPDMSALPCHQPSAVRGTIRWSVRHICSVMPPMTYCQGDCSLAVGPPIDPSMLGRVPDARPMWLNRDGGCIQRMDRRAPIV
ncbi:hypothetical protein BHM03_00046809 [Ensete ventricosum]|nr:hypothetical protein BHM03_00046809 [Ensete ventricosum]